MPHEGYKARFVTTLNAMIALSRMKSKQKSLGYQLPPSGKEYGFRSACGDRNGDRVAEAAKETAQEDQSKKGSRSEIRIQSIIDNALDWVNEFGQQLHRDMQEPLGHEFIAPVMLKTAESIFPDIDIDLGHFEALEKQRDAIIELASEQIFSSDTRMVHHAEFFNRDIPDECLLNMQSYNGSLGNSTAATAYFLERFPGNLRAWRYLCFVLQYNKHPTKMFPAEIAENLAMLLAFASVKVPKTWLNSKLEYIIGSLYQSPTLSFSSTFPVKNIFMTMAAHLVLRLQDIDVPFPSIDEYLDERCIRTVIYEAQPAVSTQIVGLWLSAYPGTKNDVKHLLEPAAKHLHGLKDFHSWIDRYVSTPWYSLAMMTNALAADKTEMLPSLPDKIAQWWDDYRHPDGSYGLFGGFQKGTLVETAHALTAALLLKKHWGIHVNDSDLFETLEFVQSKDPARSDMVPMRVGKAGYYAFYDLAQADLLSTLLLADQVLVKGDKNG